MPGDKIRRKEIAFSRGPSEARVEGTVRMGEKPILEILFPQVEQEVALSPSFTLLRVFSEGFQVFLHISSLFPL